ncbi:LacI family DNA-binding transcriptional regulator [Ammoniphilus sp. CFH 90114]|uniref:LacI family DNA-binding transcriptional regulator n=1 Tax=Ammoniphilus sp. CFH 90114 TaxID=2493665 RepID=UPI00100FAF89|nr:LacI family DNA-binding transcriptional regulator [Ammoniphilus sp. CFH 90114]RXT02376.1 LacI family transcriptional regulator [Ammoniphilus sp. CFH 90114]
MKPTITDVAKKAGVSIATVSKVMNNTGKISEATKKRVLEIMKEMEFQPSFVASALKGKSTYTIGLLIPDLANPFFAELARSIEDRGHNLGYNLVICSTDYSMEKESKYINLLKQKSVDGFILASGFENIQLVKELMEEKTPLAIVAREMPALEVDTVSVDNFLGGYLAASHLINLGHKEIAIITRDVWSNRERLRGYRQALLEAGIPFEEKIDVVEETSVECGRKMAGKFLSSARRPTAIFACSDSLAIGVFHAAREFGLKIPNDLSVIGFDDTPWAGASFPSMTTIAQPIREMGLAVTDLLVKAIKGEKETKQRLILLPKLIARESTVPYSGR